MCRKNKDDDKIIGIKMFIATGNANVYFILPVHELRTI